VALDLTLTPALIAAGNVRGNLFSIVQERRESDGFDIFRPDSTDMERS
jgi:hypothetical protein